jgi:hypothetical protein
MERTGSMKQSWVSISIVLRNKQFVVPNLDKILGFVLSIPGSSTHSASFFTGEQ